MWIYLLLALVFFFVAKFYYNSVYLTKKETLFLNLLFTEDDPRKDDFTSQLFMDQEFGSQLIEDVNSYKTKHLKFHDFQEKYIKLLV